MQATAHIGPSLPLDPSCNDAPLDFNHRLHNIRKALNRDPERTGFIKARDEFEGRLEDFPRGIPSSQSFAPFPPATESSAMSPMAAGMIAGPSPWGVAPFVSIPGDPALMGVMTPGYGQCPQFGFMGRPMQDPGMYEAGMLPAPIMEGPPIRKVLTFKSCVLYPPKPGAPPATTHERPFGCRTVFVGGLPENITEDIVREVFSQCGEISIIRMSKKNFCHVRFEVEMFVDNAILLSGYRMKIKDLDDPPNTGRLHVDFAQAKNDQYEWECRQRSLQREQRHREQVERERGQQASPPPVVYYAESESLKLSDKLKSEETFQKAVQILTTWLERGECNKRNAGHFYSMLHTTYSHVRRLLTEKQKHEDELQQAQLVLNQRLQGILGQIGRIEKVFGLASHQKVWDHFTKAQRKNIDLWRKQAEEAKNAHLADVICTRLEDEMELSDGEDSPPSKLSKLEEAENSQEEANDEIPKLQEEIDTLKCQLEAYKNEAELLRNEGQQEKDIKEQQLKVLQQALQGIQQQRARDIEEINKLKTEKSNIEASCGEKSGDGSKESASLSEVTTSLNNISGVRITEKDARLIGLVSVFLHVHPFGASLDYIWSYIQMFEPSIQPCDVEMLLSKLPAVFLLEVSGVGATLERKWKFVGFTK